MPSETIKDLFVDTLRDIFFAERQLLKALPKMARASHSTTLRQAFLDHRDQTEQHVERLQQVFELAGQRARGKTCEAIQGLIGEANELLEDMTEPTAVRDAGLIACGQAVEHYEIARYGALATWAKGLGMTDAARLLGETLSEEKAADGLLNKLAVSEVNKEAYAGS